MAINIPTLFVVVIFWMPNKKSDIYMRYIGDGSVNAALTHEQCLRKALAESAKYKHLWWHDVGCYKIDPAFAAGD